jgi:leader peptidase (prepilin peptidase)/N-methyltransferase
VVTVLAEGKEVTNQRRGEGLSPGLLRDAPHHRVGEIRRTKMSLTATWIIPGWTAVGAVTAVATQPITMGYLAKPTTPNRAPRPPPPRSGAGIGQVAVTATLFGLLAWRFGPHVELLAYSYLAAAGVPLSLIDLLELRLPRRLVLPLYPACVAFFGLATVVNGDAARLGRALGGMVVLLAAYLTTAVLSRGGLGAGDVRASGPIGLALAWLSWAALFTGTLVSLLCLTAMAASARDPLLRREVPFGPAMFIGTFFAILTSH